MVHFPFNCLLTGLVIWFLIYRHAKSARNTMVCVIFSPNSTKLTKFTMENLFLFVIIIQKLTEITIITRKLKLATSAFLTYRLNGITFKAFNRSHLETINCMCLFDIWIIIIFSIIVTHTTGVEFLTFGTLFVTTAFIMLALVN